MFLSVNPQVKKILGFSISDVTPSTIIPLITSFIESPGKKIFYGVNPHSFNVAAINKDFNRALKNADILYPEGTGTILASKVLGQSLKQRTNFLDFAFDLFALAQKKKWSIYLLGGTEEVCRQAVRKLREKFSQLKIAGFHNGYFDTKTERNILSQINKAEPMILYVAMGSPLQELWIDRNAKKLNVKAFFAIGGAIDIIAGKVFRAPSWTRSMGLEWIFRVAQEPKRLWRKYFVGNVLFLVLVFREVMAMKGCSKKDL